MSGKTYWVYISWLTSIVIVGIGGFWVGNAETSPKLLASIEEALSNVFGSNSEDFAEILDVKEYQYEGEAEDIITISTPNKDEIVLVDQVISNLKECVVDVGASPTRQPVIINEVAWMGGLESQDLSYNDEWIELRNISSSSVDIGGWQIKDVKGDVDIALPEGTTIGPGSFFLLERSNDNAVPGVIADLIYSGAIANEDEALNLFDTNCQLVDEVSANPHWPAGDNLNRRTMERSENLQWHTFSETVEEGVLGTPKASNSKNVDNQDLEVEEEISTVVEFDQCIDTNASPTREVIINEVAWAGKVDNTSEEWIELYSPDGSKSLNGWQLLDGDRSIAIIFDEEDKIEDYYLLGRILASENPDEKWKIGSAPVDKTYTGVIQNSEERLQLFNKDCVLVDEVESVGTNWKNIGGSASAEYRTAERTNNSEWHTYSGAGNVGVMGTPREKNSVPKEEVPQSNFSSGGGSSSQSSESQEEHVCSQDDLNEPTRIVLINEVAWGGNASSTSDEWLELSTEIDRGLSLSGWQLLDKDGEIKVFFDGRIDDYLLVKRILVSENPSDINTVGTITADTTFTGTINNDDETLRLFDASCNLVDEVVDVGTGWENIGGSASPEYRSAERKDVNTWDTYKGDSDIMGTPREENSVVIIPEEEDPGDSGGGGEEEPTPEEPEVIIELDITSIIYDAEGTDEGKERIVIENNSTSTIDISSFSIQYLKTGVEYSSILKKNFGAGHQVDGGGEFIIGANCSGAVPCEGVDMSWSQALGNDSGTVYLASNQEGVESAEDLDIVDFFSY